MGTAALALGLGFSFGNDSVEEPLDIVGQPIDASGNYLRMKLLSGLSFEV